MAKTNSQAIVKQIEESQMKSNIPNFTSGDTIVVYLRVIENNKTRIQKFEGTVISRRGKGLTENFIIRKDSAGVGVEKILFINSPSITKIEILKHGKVRRARIFYMRNRKGKSARIAVETKNENTKVVNQ